MSGPPENVEAEELFKKLLEMPAPSEEIDFPRQGVDDKVRVFVQRLDQHDAAEQRVAKWLAQQKLSEQGNQGVVVKDLAGDRVACELLARAIRYAKPIAGTEETGTPQYPIIFKDAEAIRKALTADEVAVLWNALLLVQHKYGPYEQIIETSEELNAWIEKLAKGASAHPLLRLSLPQFAQLTASLAARVWLLSGVLDSLLPLLPQHWASALEKSPFGIGSSIWPVVECTETGSMTAKARDADETTEGKPVDDLDSESLQAISKDFAERSRYDTI